MKNTTEAPAVEKKFAAKTASAKKTAAVKPAKKAAAPKGNPTGERKSSLFRLLNESKAAWSAFTAQKAVVIEAMVKAGAVGKKAVGVTSAALAASIGKKLTTTQPVERVVGFYMSQWQKDGIVEKLAAAE